MVGLYNFHFVGLDRVFAKDDDFNFSYIVEDKLFYLFAYLLCDVEYATPIKYQNIFRYFWKRAYKVNQIIKALK